MTLLQTKHMVKLFSLPILSCLKKSKAIKRHKINVQHQ